MTTIILLSDEATRLTGLEWHFAAGIATTKMAESNRVEQGAHVMSTIHLHRTTTLTPAQYVAGLTDFGPGRSKLFGRTFFAFGVDLRGLRL
jgi:hypothetical protein